MVSINLILACQSTPKSFVESPDVFEHSQTGIIILKQVPGWEQVGEILENVSPEISSAISYQYVSENKDLKPTATIYILKNQSTANLKIIENKVMINLQQPKFNNTETLKLKSKKRVQVVSYFHLSNLKEGDKSISMNKEIRAQSLFIQNKTKQQIVFFITINNEAKDEKAIALKFVDDILLKNSAK